MRLLALILLCSLALHVVALDHGDPIAVDRTIDAINPLSSLDLTHRLAEVEINYPRLQLRITGFAERLWLRLTLGEEGTRQFERDVLQRAQDWISGGVDTAAQDELGGRLHEIIVAGRAVSALMGTLLVLFLFLFADELFGRRTALIAAALAAVNWPLVYYSHLLNVDVPYLMWSFLAFWLAARAIRSGAAGLLVPAAVSAACAMATKDQAYGLFVLTTPTVLFLYLRPGTLARPAPERARPVPWAMLAIALVAAALVILVMPGIPIDWEWHRRHVEHITTGSAVPYRVQPRTLAGQWNLMLWNARLIRDGLGAAAAALALLGVPFLFARGWRQALLVLIPALSYLATFVAPAGFTYLRFTIPVQLLLLLPLADLITRVVERFGRMAGALVLAPLVVLGLWSAVGVDRLLLLDDTRSRAERWLRTNCTPDTRIHGVFDAIAVSVLLPPWPHASAQPPGPTPPRLLKNPPDVLVVSASEYLGFPGVSRKDHAVDPLVERYGRTYELVEHYVPDLEHVMRECVPGQPVVLIYRAVE